MCGKSHCLVVPHLSFPLGGLNVTLPLRTPVLGHPLSSHIPPSSLLLQRVCSLVWTKLGDVESSCPLGLVWMQTIIFHFFFLHNLYYCFLHSYMLYYLKDHLHVKRVNNLTWVLLFLHLSCTVWDQTN